MFPRSVKLSLRKNTQIFFKARKKHTELYTLLYLKNDVPGVAVITNKKVSTSAVQRNKVKRRIFAACIKEVEGIKTQNLQIVFRCKQPITHASYHEIERQVQHNLHEILANF